MSGFRSWTSREFYKLYFRHVCTPVADVSGRAHLRSAERRDMLVSRTRTELGRRSFQVAALTVRNSLPAHLRSTLISRRQFRDGLKSHLFIGAYFWSSDNIRFKSVVYLLTYSLDLCTLWCAVVLTDNLAGHLTCCVSWWPCHILWMNIQYHHHHLLATQSSRTKTVYAIRQMQKGTTVQTNIWPLKQKTQPRRWQIQIIPKISRTNAKSGIKSKLKPELKLSKVNIF